MKPLMDSKATLSLSVSFSHYFIGGQHIRDLGVKRLVDALQSNKTLTYLDISNIFT